MITIEVGKILKTRISKPSLPELAALLAVLILLYLLIGGGRPVNQVPPIRSLITVAERAGTK